MMVRCSTALLLLWGCGDNLPGSVTVVVAYGEPAFVAYSADADTTSRHPTLIGPSTYSFEVHSDFVFTAVVPLADGGYWSQQLAATYEDGAEWIFLGASDVGAFPTNTLVPPSLIYDPAQCAFTPPSGGIQLSGKILEAGEVKFAGQCASSTSSPWTFMFDARPGTHDLIACTLPGAVDPRVLISRDVNLVSSKNLGDLDLAQGIELTTTPFDLKNAMPNASISVSTFLTTANDTARISSGVFSDATSVSALSIPGEKLQANDVQTTELHAVTDASTYDQSTRVISSAIDSSGLSMLTVPSVLVADGVASWNDGLDSRSNFVTLSYVSQDNAKPTFVQQVTASRAWLERRSPASVSFDTSVSGFRDDWRFRSSPYSWTFDVAAQAPRESAKATVAGGGSSGGSSREQQAFLLAGSHQRVMVGRRARVPLMPLAARQ